MKNKGGYIASLTLRYKLFGKNEVLTKSNLLAPNQYVFSLNYCATDVYLDVKAVLGKKVIDSFKITSMPLEPQCFHVWGTTLNPKWSQIDC